MTNPLLIETPRPRALCSRCGDHGYTLDGERTAARVFTLGAPCSCRAGGRFVEQQAEWSLPDRPVIEARAAMRGMGRVVAMPTRGFRRLADGPEAA